MSMQHIHDRYPRPAGYYRTMQPDFAAERYGFPTDAHQHDKWSAADGSKWTRGVAYWHRVMGTAQSPLPEDGAPR